MKLIRTHLNLKINNIQKLKNTAFVDFPHSLLLIFIMLSFVFLGWLCHLFFLRKNHEKIFENNQHMIELNQSLKKQLIFIQSEKKYAFQADSLSSRSNSTGPSNFIKQLSTLSKKNHVDIQTIKPINSNDFMNKNKTTYSSDRPKKSVIVHLLQIDVFGKYLDILNFLLEIQHISILTTIDNFKITPAHTEKYDQKGHETHLLHLMITLDLYEYSS